MLDVSDFKKVYFILKDWAQGTYNILYTHLLGYNF